MVKVELDLVGRGRDRLRTRVLDLLDEVLVGLLGETTALLRVEVDVVDVERRRREGLGRRARGVTRRLRIRAVLPRLEVDGDADFVVLERNERDRKTRVATEPELERDVERLRRRTRSGNTGLRDFRRRARRIETNARARLEENEVVRVADEGVERRDVARLRAELRPDLHPVTVLAVDALAADFDLNLLDEAVTDVVQPAETVDAVAELRRRGNIDLGEDDLNVRLVHKIGVTVDNRLDTRVEVRTAVERNFDGLHREVRVALVEDLPERDLRVAGDVDILGSV